MFDKFKISRLSSSGRYNLAGSEFKFGYRLANFLIFSLLIPLPVTNWASDEDKFIPNYSVEIIIFFIL